MHLLSEEAGLKFERGMRVRSPHGATGTVTKVSRSSRKPQAYILAINVKWDHEDEARQIPAGHMLFTRLRALNMCSQCEEHPVALDDYLCAGCREAQ